MIAHLEHGPWFLWKALSALRIPESRQLRFSAFGKRSNSPQKGFAMVASTELLMAASIRADRAAPEFAIVNLQFGSAAEGPSGCEVQVFNHMSQRYESVAAELTTQDGHGFGVAIRGVTEACIERSKGSLLVLVHFIYSDAQTFVGPQRTDVTGWRLIQNPRRAA